MTIGTTITEEQNAAVLDILWGYATHLGIGRRPYADDVDAPAWDGTGIRAFPNCDDISHELAHWLIATPDQRAQVDYGWGWDWQWTADDVDMGSTRDAYDETNGSGADELLVCVLGNSILIRSGHPDVRGIYEHYSFYNYTTYGERHVLDSGTPWLRRAVQPHVAAFETWKATR